METCCRNAGGERNDGFNGATAFRRWKRDKAFYLTFAADPLQWGHRLSAMETRVLVPFNYRRDNASMGPPPFGDGNDTDQIDRSDHDYGFNGATAFRRWKQASRVLAVGRNSRFNGATAFRRWKPRPSVLSTLLFYSLQWGHRLSAMETGEVGFLPVFLTVASMGPPPFGDGNATSRIQISFKPSSFNGATAFRRWKPACGA